jgi:two-component system, response regulator YesN
LYDGDGANNHTVREYLMRLRITIARRLLAESDAKLDAVASRVGFADASTLSSRFFDLMGVRPEEFRRSLQRRG